MLQMLQNVSSLAFPWLNAPLKDKESVSVNPMPEITVLTIVFNVILFNVLLLFETYRYEQWTNCLLPYHVQLYYS